ncbi:adenine nucleotide transporter [Dentipellis sp. KUC8613]|nr:adenine nucleotide transporter [Dentipellis sp. KUC8613]
MPVQSKPQQLTPFGYALAGALGACFSNAVVYPLDTIKTRIQAANVDDEEEAVDPAELTIYAQFRKILREEGLAGCYRGFAATMLNTFSMQYAYFFFYSLVRTSYIRRLSARRPAGSKAPPLSTAAELLLGALAGALAQVFTIPVAVIATRQQIGHPHAHAHAHASAAEKGKAPAAADADEERDDSFFGVAREIIREEGVTGLWLGLQPGLVLTVNPAITYGAYERVKGVLVRAQEAAGKGSKLGPWMSFLLGALSKSLATVVTYPYIMAKVRIQTRSADLETLREEGDAEHQADVPEPLEYHHKHSKHAGALDVLLRAWRHQGFKGWYQGMSAQITKAVISQALLFMSKEKFEHWALAIMILLYRLRARAIR